MVADALATLPDRRTPTREDWAGLSAGWPAQLDARIDQLTRLRDRLTDCIGCGCLSIDRCSSVNGGHWSTLAVTCAISRR